jgi:hypothetical protein
MEILLKKDSTGKNSIDIKELSSILGLSSLIEKLENRIKDLENKNLNLEKIIKEHSKINGLDVIQALTNSGIINFNSPINVSCPPSIEKIESIPNGCFYYDVVNDKFKIKIKNNWETIK